MSKLKEYIKNQEEIEMSLAVECSQTKGVVKLSNFLLRKVGRLSHCFWMSVVGRD